MIQRTAVFNVILAATILGLSACSTMVSKPIAESKRDNSGSFDGNWKLVMQAAPEKQNIEKWVFTCPNMKGEMNFRVSSGEAKIRVDNRNTSTFVDAKGRIRFEIPLKGVAKASASSFESILKGERTLIIQGTMGGKKSAGLVTYGIAQFGNNGCSTRAKFVKQ